MLVKARNKIKQILRVKIIKKIGVVLLAVLFVLPIYVWLNQEKIEAAWWNDTWMYRKAITVTNASGTELTDFQVKILDNKDLSADITAGKIQSDLDDLRFTDINSNLLPYWIEDATGSSVDVWIKIPKIPTSGATVYMYYGNISATNVQDGNRVFEFFDDFSGSSLDTNKWTSQTGLPSVSGGELILDGAEGLFAGSYLIPENTVWEAKSNPQSTSRSGGAIRAAQTSGAGWVADGGANIVDILWWTNNALYGEWNSGEYLFYNGYSSGYANYKIVYRPGGTDSATYYYNNGNSYTRNGNITQSVYPVIYSGNGQSKFDYFFVRKYVSTDPSASTSGSEEKSQGPVAYWSFDEGTGTTANDGTSNNNDGTLTNMSTTPSPTSGWQTEGCVSGKCLAFDGTDDYVDAGSFSSFNNQEERTLSAWINISSIKRNPIIDKYNHGIEYQSDGKIKMWIRDSTGNWPHVTTDETYPANSWIHVVGVYKANTYLKIYINGQLRKNSVISTEIDQTYTPSNLFIGKTNHIGGVWFAGKIDEPKIYSYARTAAQIKQDYNAGLTGMGTNKGNSASIGGESKKWMSDGLVGYWSISDNDWNSSTGEITDNSGANNKGINYGTNLVKDRLGRENNAMRLETSAESLLLNYRTWAEGQTGGVGVFSQNGATSENFRVIDNDPWGRKVPVWEARTDVDSNADGGWESSSIAVDQTKMYRFSTWIRRTVLGNGSYYLGTYGKNSSGTNFGVLNRSNGAINTNPYFRANSGGEITSATDWFLLVGHVWPVGSGTGSVHVDTGLYNEAGTKIAIPSDFVWQDGTVYTVHRSYLYYSTDTNTRQQWVYPRLDVIDGTEPTIAELLAGHDRYGYSIDSNISGDKKSFAFWYDANSDGGWEYIVKSDNNFFVNGKSATPSEYPVYVSGDNIFVGRTTSNSYLNGSIDEVRIYNRALSPQEVADLYNYAPGPVGWWKMDEGSGTTAVDSSGNGNNGTLVNNPTWTQGKYGGALSVSASNYITVADNPVHQMLGSSFTTSSWVKTNGNSNYFLRKANGQEWYYQYVNPGGLHQCGTKDGTTEKYLNSTGKIINDGYWHYVSCVWDRNANLLRNYVDGVQIATLDITGFGSVDNSSTLELGNGVTGNIDDVKIYNYARTQKQIVEDMNAGHPAGGSPVGSQVGYWKFDEGFGMTAYNSGNGGSALNGTISGAIWTNDGKFGKALNFDGTDDYANMTSDSALKPEYVSISAWIKPTNLSIARDILSKTWSYSGDLYWLRVNTNGTIYFQVGTTDTIAKSFTTSGTVLLNQWSHIVATFDGSKAYVYINGTKDSNSLTVNPSQTLGPSTYPLYIGRRSNYFAGFIDEVKVYNYALTDEEVKLDYDQGKSLVLGSKGTESDGKTPSFSASREYCVPGDTATCNPPIAEWKFDEMTGSYAEDTSGNGNRGTLQNSPSWISGGKYNSGLNFNGSGKRVTIATPFGQAGYTTVALWYKRSESDASTSWRTLLGHASANIHHLIINSTSRNLGIWDGAWKDFSYNPPDDNKWHHYEVIYSSGTSATLYVDGVYKNQISTTLDLSANPIGSIGNWGSGSYWAGPIDDVKIYNYARTPAQIAWDYNRGKPVGWWKMDEGEGSTVYDHSGNANNGTMTNMDPATDWVNGKINKALDFDGSNDYVEINSANIKTIGNMTASLWVKPNSLSAFTAMGNYIAGSGGFMINNESDSRLFYQFFYSSGNASGYVNNVFAINEWVHIVLTTNKDSGKGRIYVNGILKEEVNVPGGVAENAGNLYFGMNNHTGTPYRWFNGQIDDARIYNYALTAEQVKQIYNDGAVNFK